ELFGKGISIKTITGKSLNGVKLIWTVDAKKAKEFLESYYPKYDILLAQINWNGEGALFFLPVSSQLSAFKKIGREEYIKLPKEGTNPRGVEISHKALSLIVGEKGSRKIAIEWTKREIEFNAFDRWVDYWRED
ncbi:MAG: ThaI family type II restriction endonuclease, partial [Acidobacteriota bacterium]